MSRGDIKSSDDVKAGRIVDWLVESLLLAVGLQPLYLSNNLEPQHDKSQLNTHSVV